MSLKKRKQKNKKKNVAGFQTNKLALEQVSFTLFPDSGLSTKYLRKPLQRIKCQYVTGARGCDKTPSYVSERIALEANAPMLESDHREEIAR